MSQKDDPTKHGCITVRLHQNEGTIISYAWLNTFGHGEMSQGGHTLLGIGSQVISCLHGPAWITEVCHICDWQREDLDSTFRMLDIDTLVRNHYSPI